MNTDKSLSDALASIAHIRLQMARGEVFRGSRSVTTAMTGAIAVGLTLFQSVVPPPTNRNYVMQWLAAAIVSMIIVGVDLALRFRRSPSDLQRELSLRVVEQFMPCLTVGALLTFVVVRFAPGSLWLMPGIWAILFGLGVFATRRMLPHGASVVGGWYLLSGLCGIVLASRDRTHSAPANGSELWHRPVSRRRRPVLEPGAKKWDVLKTNQDRAQGSGVREAGRFAYGSLERLFHERARLSIVSSLAAHRDGVVFSDLKVLCA